MMEKLIFLETDRVLVVAPHPDDEALGAAAPLLFAPEKTDILVVTDGCRGCRSRSKEEEAAVRRRQFDAEVALVEPHAVFWLGLEDATLTERPLNAEDFDFTPYTKIFLPWDRDFHADHVSAAKSATAAIRTQKAAAECFFYEITAPFYRPTHFADVSAVMEDKKRLIRCHADQHGHEEIVTALNAFRAAQLYREHKCKYAEAYLRVD